MPIKNDVVFHLYFGDEENKDDLKSFLKSVLELPEEEYDVLYISDPFLRGEYPKEKIGIVDLKIKTKSGKTIHIEVQLLVLPDLRKRIFFYDAKLIAEQIGSGGKYSTINDVVTILITDEILIQESPRYHHRFTFFDKDACVELTDLLRIHTLELPKLPPVPDGTELHDWASFIAAETEEELNMVSERNEQIGHAADKLRILSNDQRARELYELRLKEWRDIESFKD
ncbi:MAG: Rpn family recombination-promoting nuclease/putative transposase, partial [Deltaproteobacteria bacterium]|nr:Rpn family recombination-promoting nuclease/putative transposase [Deltaproteobacteria bacterium]